MAGRVPRLSADGWKFKDGKSMAISFAVVAVLLCCMYGFSQNQKSNALGLLASELSAQEEELEDLFEKRFELAGELAQACGDAGLQEMLGHKAATDQETSDKYLKSDQYLAALQRKLAASGTLDEYASYFSFLSGVEDEIVARYATYQARRDQYEKRLGKKEVRRGAKQFPLWEITPALSARP